MKPTLLYRNASGLLISFAIGHTYGFLGFRLPTPEGVSVWRSWRFSRIFNLPKEALNALYVSGLHQ